LNQKINAESKNKKLQKEAAKSKQQFCQTWAMK
jgi:hypothetical protein